MKTVASLRYGVIFKKAFCDPEIFKAFVKDCLGIELEIDHVETEKSFLPSIGNVATRFDLFAEDKKNRIIVDIQHEKFPDHYDRFLHYHCVALLEQITNSTSYIPQLKVFTIVVLTSGDKYKKDILTIDFDPKDRNGNLIGEIPHKILYLCPKYINESTPESYREWMRAIHESQNEEVDESLYKRKEIHKVFDIIKKDSISPIERAKMKDEYGIEQIKEEKYEEGLKKGKLETAAALISEGLDINLIAKVTGLSADEIQQNC